MSKIDRRIVRCRECGKEFEAEFYGSINTALNPELIEKVRDGSIFEVECPHCKKINHLHYPCLYHDQKNEFMVQLNSFKNLLLLKETIDNGDDNPMLGALNKKYTFVGATNYADWLTSIVCLENKLDWRAAKIAISEYLKRVQSNKEHGIKSIDYYVLSGVKNKENQLVLSVGINEEKEVHPTFPYKMYEKIMEMMKDNLDFMDPFVFEEEEMEFFMKTSLKNYKYSQPDLKKVYFVSTSDGYTLLCNIITGLSRKIHEDDMVTIETRDKQKLNVFVDKIMKLDINRVPIANRVDGTVVEKVEW